MHFTADVGGVVLPADAPAVAGTRTFPGSVQFNQTGAHSLSVQDNAVPPLTSAPSAFQVYAVTSVGENGLGSGVTCAILNGGGVKCWGENLGQMGLGDGISRGLNAAEMGSALPFVDLGSGRTARQVAVGLSHACAVLDDSSLKCWGIGGAGELGQESNTSRGLAPGQMGDSLPSINLGPGRSALKVAVGTQETCVILDTRAVKCWGANFSWCDLGYSYCNPIGTNTGDMSGLGTIDLGSNFYVQDLTVGGGSDTTAGNSKCAISTTGSLKCWGRNWNGQLGLDDNVPRGNGPGQGGMGDSLPTVNLGPGRTARDVVEGAYHTCALLDDYTVKCWGPNFNGALGLGDTSSRGNNGGDMGRLPTVDLGTGRTARRISAGQNYTCAVLDTGGVKCWGQAKNGGSSQDSGKLGQGTVNDIGSMANQMGDNLPTISLGTGRTAVELYTAVQHVCALLDNGTVKCWGFNDGGQLGQGDTQTRGAAPGQMGNALPSVRLW